MTQDSKQDSAVAAMRQINRIWLDSQVQDIAPMVHPDVVMVVPGFVGRVQGREKFLAGFQDFRQNAKIHKFREFDHQVDVAGDTAVVTFRYDMVYELSGQRYRSTGRDLWVFQNEENAWIAVWRTMLDTEEEAA